MSGRTILGLLALLIVVVLIAACVAPTATPGSVVVPVEVESTAPEEVEPAAPEEVPVETEVVVTTEPSVGVRLVGWRPTSPEEEDLQRYLLDRCGVTYDFEVSQAAYWARLQVMFAGGEEFDILYMDTPHFPFYAGQGFLAPLDESDQIGRDEFIDALVEAFTYQDTTYAIPRDFSALALFYNIELFDEAGIELPTNDWNWDDLKVAAWDITDSTGVAGFSVPVSPARFSIFVSQNGGWVMTEDFSDTLIDYAEAIEAGEFYTNALWDGWAILPEDVGVSWQGDAFGVGGVAMVLETYWTTRYLAEFPDLDYGAVHPPSGRHGDEGNLLFATAYAVSANSFAQEAAWDAIACLTSEESQSEILWSGLALPSRKVLPDEAYSEYFQENPVAEAIFTGAEFATPYTWGPRHQEVEWIIQDALERVYEGMSVDESFWQAADEIRNAISQ